MIIDLVVGVRPEIIQAAALLEAFSAYPENLDARLIYSGQHYDPELSSDHLEQLKIDRVHAALNVSGHTGVIQLAELLKAYDEQLNLDPPDMIMVIGNSNTALAASMVGARRGIPIAHVDSGVRSHDLSIIEEQNDTLIDKLTSYHFTSSGEGAINLIREGYDNQQIVEVGNVRSDAVFMNLGYAEDSRALDKSGLVEGGYMLVTLHHRHTLSETAFIVSLFTYLETLSERLPVFVVLHPGAAYFLEDIPELILEPSANFQIVSSRNYQDMLKLIKHAALVLTDSQGLQEETALLGVQCLTVANTTNRPDTLSRGTNTLTGYDVQQIQQQVAAILDGDKRDSYPIDGWDGKAAQRLVKFISEL